MSVTKTGKKNDYVEPKSKENCTLKNGKVKTPKGNLDDNGPK